MTSLTYVTLVAGGVTDNTTALQNALDAAHTAGGGVIYLDYGVFLTQGVVVYANTSIIGTGKGTVLKAAGTTATALISIDSAATGVVLNNFSIDVNNVSGVDGVLLDNTGVSQDSLHRLDRLWVYRAGRDGIHLGPAVIETIVSNCYVMQSGRHGYHTEVGATDNRFLACTAGASKEDGFWVQGNNTSYTACKSFYSGWTGSAFVDGYNGFTFKPSTGEDLHAISLANCESQNNARNGYYADGSATSAICTYFAFTNCISDGNNEIGTTGAGFALNRVLYSTFSNCLNRQQTPGSVTYGLALFNDLSYTVIDGGYFNGSAGTVYIDASAVGNYKIRDCRPYNPRGLLSPPAVPASNVNYTNKLRVDCMVRVSGGAVSDIKIAGSSTGTNSGWVRVPVGQTISVTYTTVPAWTWWGE